MRQWGGPRLGSGRTRGPEENVRRNRIAIMLTDAELERLKGLAEQQRLPLGTVAYNFVAKGLKRAR